MKLELLILLLLVISAETGAQFFLEKSAQNKAQRNIFLALGIASYMAVGYVYYLILNHGSKLAIANSLWNAGTAITVSITGYLFFKEKLTMIQVLGLSLVVLGVYLME